MTRLSAQTAVEVAQTAYDTISFLKANNAALKEAVAPLAAENIGLKAKLEALEQDDALVDDALSKLSALLNPLNVPGDPDAVADAVPDENPGV